MFEPPENIPFEVLIKQLLDADQPLPADYFYRLSDLERDEQQSLQNAWRKIPLWRRQAIMEDVSDLSAEDMILSFIGCSLVAITDEEANIRRLAVQSLWEYDENELIPIFLRLLQEDTDPSVRAAAAGALGSFVYKGEIEELDQDIFHQIENFLLEIIQSEQPPIVRRSALEAVSFSSRAEVAELIKQAFASKEKEWKASALFAMGRSGDSKWRKQVLSMLEHTIPMIRMEAARAAGELELNEATESLIELLDDPDEETRMASIWSLSQLGGEGVQELLEELMDQSEGEILDFIASALDNLEQQKPESIPIVRIRRKQ